MASERQSAMYRHATSRKERGDGEAPERKAEPAPAAKIDKEDDAAPKGGEAMRGGHAAERQAMHGRHHEERRALMAGHLREHKAMDAEHEAQHKGVSEPAALVALHRHHLHAKHNLHQKHMDEAHAQRTAHHNERMALAQKHESEMLGGMPNGGESEQEAA